MQEKHLSKLVAEWLQYRHPKVIYRFDLAADLRMSIGQATRNKKMHPVRGYPDLFIAEPKNGYSGLYVELKTVKGCPYLKDGSLSKIKHIQEQKAYLDKLSEKGYMAVFCCGFDETIKIINSYLLE